MDCFLTMYVDNSRSLVLRSGMTTSRGAAHFVPCGAGGTLADYVPFYFAPRSPMLYAITGGLVSVAAARTEEIVYLVSSTQTLRAAGLTVIASNRHAELDYAEITDHDEALDRDGFIDWPLMTATYWNNTPDDPDRKERRQAECLVHPLVPWQLIEGVATKSERARRATGAHEGVRTSYFRTPSPRGSPEARLLSPGQRGSASTELQCRCIRSLR